MITTLLAATPGPARNSLAAVIPPSAIVAGSIAGTGLLAIGGWMLWRKKSKRLVTWVWIIAGIMLTGGLATALTSAFSTVGGAGAVVFGISARVFMAIAGVIAILELHHHLRRKGGGRSAGTDLAVRGSGGGGGRGGSVAGWVPYLGLTTPLLIVAGEGGLLYAVYVWIAKVIFHVAVPVSGVFGA